MARAAGWRRRLQARARKGAIVLLFGDESEALTHPYLAHVWARKGADLRVPAPGQAAKVAMRGVLDWKRGEWVVHTSARKRSADFLALLAELDWRWGPCPGIAAKPVVLVLDNGPIHTSTATRAALAARRDPNQSSDNQQWRIVFTSFRAIMRGRKRAAHEHRNLT